MKGHAAIILFIGAMIAAGVVVGVFFDARDQVQVQAPAQQAPASQAAISGVSVYGISDGSAKHATIEISGGQEPLNLSELALTLSTDDGSRTVSP